VSTIKFGTDGWRGVIAEDFTFSNVRKVACAIARYVVRAEKPGAGVLIGYDTRYGSERFARAAAEVVSMAGMPVWIAEKACPSPALSLLVRQRGAALDCRASGKRTCHGAGKRRAAAPSAASTYSIARHSFSIS